MNNSYNKSVTSHDQDKVVFTFLGHVLNTIENCWLSKGLNLSIPPKNINYAGFMLPFELFYRDVDSLEVSNLVKELSKVGSETLDKNLPKVELDALNNLFKNKHIIVKKLIKVIQLSFLTERIMFV